MKCNADGVSHLMTYNVRAELDVLRLGFSRCSGKSTTQTSSLPRRSVKRHC